MFTGIIEGLGGVKHVEPRNGGLELSLSAPFPLKEVRKGDSIAVNGCCLTVVRKTPRMFVVELSRETLRLTTFGQFKKGTPVNLERALRLGDRMGGHWVQGHVDGLGRITHIQKKGIAVEMKIRFPRKLRRYFILKGSVAVDGISMTVNALKNTEFSLVIIPQTYQVTNLHTKKSGDPVHLEVDIVGKYLENLAKQPYEK